MHFILDKLQEMNSRSAFWHGHLNMSKIGIVGHSMGGTTAALATKEDQRIAAGVNLDGSTYPGLNNDIRPIELNKPLLFLATEEHASDPGVRAREYSGSKSNTYYVVVPQNNISWERALLAVEITRSLVAEFLGKYSKGAPAPALDLPIHVVRE